MYQQLKNIGVEHPEKIERYSLRQEASYDTLKIYFSKPKGDLFARSMKFKYPRQRKNVVVDSGTGRSKEVTEINRSLSLVIDELDQIVQHEHTEQDVKQKVLTDLRHLEKVVASKIAEIEAELEKL
ncbi:MULTISPECIES: DUF3461 family protein [Salinivibrio]|jgi:Protein of unknown function (DUF3461).|uniref:DUF3461 family protein n=1 Tax=Salinivibrio costicola subsp. alcaliphilus TaxID=272773 RepID=A0ABX3KRP9_SALCS|nr:MULTISPECIES: DUF3461 family protein [Salinivibrio]NUY56789.1 DUF3461 family protein [Salinivibrio sp. EAGSL]OOE92150.1 hypothetical protein BZG75_09525 [Salinivibrio sp. AR640]OOE94118.1 hypothetical protein BZG76_00145 [Salinivibrio sp. AR647]OOE98251.1 hypothetical protein BZG78_09470 [Salinivibrio sp. MA351]OOE99658.1 hypothetical protein BZG77_02895 [Salinivibrio sp. IB643]